MVGLAIECMFEIVTVNQCNTGFWLLGSKVQKSTFALCSLYVASKRAHIVPERTSRRKLSSHYHTSQ
ncbi:hypothetical protein A2673_02020 [Candidatus Kaiserbacteria bacterium RIFCSPHIGHO2_01_FULL_50_13]|uniref:Uncharacterized protein n=1 Tax=Candidatus Kaiserbacteria bacterium RIFCSPLOWO2_01_FULL_50_24 TaxID=1798507 RepID=A0A1F6ER17_9BACT|nr:MAG: hypothetical protein A2673_02020 [Candidatus Kaiserbacteria bacterium RIFCSPHIGHO2_01_FULL_50_13]OGG76071.1 MAG: hypothetical protein A3A34_00525 [Candidatus Kaiserbacteria bacterium RIFCSPLOWO2_01_FULL_50_24]OGG81700.1 MAG: hypothetical protein A3H74_02825 [Candidatus Kaiserbacteria bacterium RIFCSPLOWO2_02_FULL_51_13]